MVLFSFNGQVGRESRWKRQVVNDEGELMTIYYIERLNGSQRLFRTEKKERRRNAMHWLSFEQKRLAFSLLPSFYSGRNPERFL